MATLVFERPNPKQELFLRAEQPFVMYGGARGGGKAQPLDEPVLTPFGFVQMGELQVGSVVCNPDGTVAKVIQVHPQGVQPIYKVTFVDGGSTRVTAEHLWLIWRTCRDSGYKIADTKTIMGYMGDRLSNVLVPLCEPVTFTVPSRWEVRQIKPYTLGVLIGDGCLSGQQTTFTTEDREIIDGVIDDGYTVSIHKNSGNHGKANSCGMLSFKEEQEKLGRMGLLVKSGEKFIPKEYKYAPLEDRLKLIQGLMDTDGTADTRGHCSFATISKQLAKDVQWLIRSIGGKATISKKIGKYTKNGKTVICNDVYEVYIQTKINPDLFTVERKKERCSYEFNGGVSELKRRIISIEPCGEAECQCITVDNPNGLYITKDFIVTHNSHVVRDKATLLCLAYPGIKILLVRKRFTDLDENHIKPLQQKLSGVAKWKDKDKSFVFPNGSRIRCSHCEFDSDLDSFQGQEYDVIFIDEATQIPEYQFGAIALCKRGANDFPKRIYLTCNPGGVGHDWVKRLFIDRDFRGQENPDDYLFIPARATDNHALMEKQPEYLQMLDNLPDGLREAWRDGSWDSFMGQFLSEFDRNVHVMNPFEIPVHWRRFVTLDYGLDMTAALWIAVDERGKSYVYRELYEKDLIISDAALKIKEFSAGERIYEYLAPPDIWSRGQESGKSRAEIFADNDVFLTKTSNSRVDGWATVKEIFKIFKDDEGRADSAIKIFSTCLNLIRCLPKLQYSEKNPGDVATEPHEITHAPDALRGFCIHRRGHTPALAGPAPITNFRFERAVPIKPGGYGEKVMVI